MFDALEVTGRVRTHVWQYAKPRFAAHREAALAFLAMRAAALRDGIDLIPCSAFRGFTAQLRIWNTKFAGKKPLYDIDGRPRDFAGMTPVDIVRAILNWSALPGGSRHQWGSEIDVFDAAAVPPGYVPKLLPEEVAPGGVFHRLHAWLGEHMRRYGLFRPYGRYQGGMYPEPWQLSYAPVSQRAIECLTLEVLADAIGPADMLGKAIVLDMLPELYENHIRNVAAPE